MLINGILWAKLTKQ